MEVGIPRADPANAMLTHQDRGLGIMQKIAREMGKLGKSLFHHFRMP